MHPSAMHPSVRAKYDAVVALSGEVAGHRLIVDRAKDLNGIGPSEQKTIERELGRLERVERKLIRLEPLFSKLPNNPSVLSSGRFTTLVSHLDALAREAEEAHSAVEGLRVALIGTREQDGHELFFHGDVFAQYGHHTDPGASGSTRLFPENYARFIAHSPEWLLRSKEYLLKHVAFLRNYPRLANADLLLAYERAYEQLPPGERKPFPVPDNFAQEIAQLREAPDAVSSASKTDGVTKKTGGLASWLRHRRGRS